MKILVLNCGSSSIKYALYNMDDKSVMTSGGAERVGLDGAFVKVKLAMESLRVTLDAVAFSTPPFTLTRQFVMLMLLPLPSTSALA